jgi:hypothetical protein
MTASYSNNRFGNPKFRKNRQNAYNFSVATGIGGNDIYPPRYRNFNRALLSVAGETIDQVLDWREFTQSIEGADE